MKTISSMVVNAFKLPPEIINLSPGEFSDKLNPYVDPEVDIAPGKAVFVDFENPASQRADVLQGSLYVFRIRYDSITIDKKKRELKLNAISVDGVPYNRLKKSQKRYYMEKVTTEMRKATPPKVSMAIAVVDLANGLLLTNTKNRNVLDLLQQVFGNIRQVLPAIATSMRSLGVKPETMLRMINDTVGLEHIQLTGVRNISFRNGKIDGSSFIKSGTLCFGEDESLTIISGVFVKKVDVGDQTCHVKINLDPTLYPSISIIGAKRVPQIDVLEAIASIYNAIYNVVVDMYVMGREITKEHSLEVANMLRRNVTGEEEDDGRE